MKTVISSKGQIVLPSPLRDQDRILAGQEFDIERVEPGTYLLKRRAIPDNQGFIAWLVDCPERGWFTPLPSESTEIL